jgi:hypothetical protein
MTGDCERLPPGQDHSISSDAGLFPAFTQTAPVIESWLTLASCGRKQAEMQLPPSC